MKRINKNTSPAGIARETIRKRIEKVRDALCKDRTKVDGVSASAHEAYSEAIRDLYHVQAARDVGNSEVTVNSNKVSHAARMTFNFVRAFPGIGTRFVDEMINALERRHDCDDVNRVKYRKLIRLAKHFAAEMRAAFPKTSSVDFNIPDYVEWTIEDLVPTKDGEK
jgi:hypothetical protein